MDRRDFLGMGAVSLAGPIGNKDQLVTWKEILGKVQKENNFIIFIELENLEEEEIKVYLKEIAQYVLQSPKADELIMRKFEDKQGVPIQGAYDFRRDLIAAIGARFTLDVEEKKD